LERIIHTTTLSSKFLLGGVSISNQFSDFSKSLMIEFEIKLLRSYIAQYVHPRKQSKIEDADKDFFNETEADLNKFENY
jgi:hypothetical protein